MADNIKDHGFWRPYKPNPMPEWAREASVIGGAIVFFRRDDDGADFYDYLKSHPFGSGAVVATAVPNGSGAEIVGTVFRDESMLQPFNQRLIEFGSVDPAETKPHNLFAGKIYDPTSRTLSDPPPRGR